MYVRLCGIVLELRHFFANAISVNEASIYELSMNVFECSSAQMASSKSSASDSGTQKYSQRKRAVLLCVAILSQVGTTTIFAQVVRNEVCLLTLKTAPNTTRVKFASFVGLHHRNTIHCHSQERIRDRSRPHSSEDPVVHGGKTCAGITVVDIGQDDN